MVEERSGERRGPSERVPRGRVRRALVLVLVAAAGIVVGRLVVVVLDRGVTAAAPAAPPAAEGSAAEGSATGATSGNDAVEDRSLRRAAAVLHAWDDRRAAAYARGDPAALRRLYLPGSRAGARDLQVLRAYAERGLVVRDLRTQVLSLRVLRAGDHLLRLEVTDRRVGGEAVGRSLAVALPRDGPSSRVVELHEIRGAWRVGSVQMA